MFEMAGDFVLGNADAFREIACRRRTRKQHRMKLFPYGGVAATRLGGRSLVHGLRL